MPVIIRNSSPDRWLKFPVPLDAMLILPGLALAYSINSRPLLAGNDGLTSKTKESLLMLATGTMSRVTSDQARNDVGRAAGGNEDDHANRPYRIALRPRDARDRRQQGSAGGQMQKISAGKFHSVPL